MLHNVSDEDIRTALLPFGKVTDVFHEKWRVQGVQDKASSTRAVSLVLKTGMTVEDLPHQLRVAGEQTLVVVPGRAPLCLKCRNTGHVRRDCRVPKCAVCRRYGHQDTECVKTYASVAGPALREDVADLLMDEADVDEASRVLVPPADIVATPYVPAAKATKVVNVLPTSPKDAVQRPCDEGAKEESAAKSATAEEAATEHGPATPLMDVEESSASNVAMKRARDSTGNLDGSLDGNLDNGPKTSRRQKRRRVVVCPCARSQTSRRTDGRRQNRLSRTRRLLGRPD